MRMAITRFEPFRELAAVQARLNRIFNEPYEAGDDTLVRADWVPAVDVIENDQHALVLTAELPGVKKEDINVTVDGAQVTLAAEVKREKEVTEHDRLLHSERAFGKVTRTFTLPQELDEAKVEA